MAQAKERSLRMLTTALEMEEKGKKFYDEAIAKCGNPLGKEIFTTLRDDEILHVDRIKAIYATVGGGMGWTDAWTAHMPTHRELNPLFRELAARHGTEITADTSDLAALDVGIDFEGKAVEFYSDHLREATDDKERRFIELMVKEEKGHHKVLRDMKLYLSDPAAWFTEQERAGLDGA